MTKVKEYGLMFSPEMIAALLDGRKDMTRRTRGLKLPNEHPNDWELWQHSEDFRFWIFRKKGARHGPVEIAAKCPFTVGDNIYAKEPHAFEKQFDHLTAKEIQEVSAYPAHWYKVGDKYIPHEYYNFECGRWRSSMFMPRWAARIRREITSIKCERVQSITEEDAVAEGFQVVKLLGEETWWQGYIETNMGDLGIELMHQEATGEKPPDWMIEPHKMLARPDLVITARSGFIGLWDRLGGKKHPWATNLWCFVYSLKEVKNA